MPWHYITTVNKTPMLGVYVRQKRNRMLQWELHEFRRTPVPWILFPRLPPMAFPAFAYARTIATSVVTDKVDGGMDAKHVFLVKMRCPASSPSSHLPSIKAICIKHTPSYGVLVSEKTIHESKALPELRPIGNVHIVNVPDTLPSGPSPD